jgi:hypothetical protein
MVCKFRHLLEKHKLGRADWRMRMLHAPCRLLTVPISTDARYGSTRLRPKSVLVAVIAVDSADIERPSSSAETPAESNAIPGRPLRPGPSGPSPAYDRLILSYQGSMMVV